MFEVVVVSRRYPFARGTSHARGVAYGRHPPLMHSVSSRAGPLSPSIRSDLASCRARALRPSLRAEPHRPRDRARGLAADPHPAPATRPARRTRPHPPPPRPHPRHDLLSRRRRRRLLPPPPPPTTRSSSAWTSARPVARAVVVDASGDVRHESVAKYPPIVDGGKGGDGIPDGGWAEAWRGALWTLLDRVPLRGFLPRRGGGCRRHVRHGAHGGWCHRRAHLPPCSTTKNARMPCPPWRRWRPRDTPCAARRARCVSYTRGGRSRLRRRRRRARLLHHADWIAFLLHGEMGVTDHNNALKLGFDPAGEGSYPSWLSGAPYASTLPARVLPPGTRAGTVASAEARSRLPEGCVVVAGTTDSVAAFVAARCTSPGDCVTSLGSSLALKMVSETRRGRFRQGGVQSSPVRRLARRRRVQPRRMASPLVLHRRRTRDAHRADGRRANGLGRRSRLFPRAFSWGSGSPSRKPPRRSSRDPMTTSRSCAPSSNPSRGWRREARRWSTWAPVTRPPACSTAGRGEEQKWSRVRSRAMGGVPVDKSPYAEAAYGAALLARMGHYELTTYVPDA